MIEERIGAVSHFYSHLGVAAVALERELKVGDTIHVKGHTSDFMQRIDSIQIERHDVEKAKGGDSVGIRVIEHAREHDTVYKIIEEGKHAA